MFFFLFLHILTLIGLQVLVGAREVALNVWYWISLLDMHLKYGHFVFPDPTHSSVPTIVDNIADAVTHARFVGTDQSSDGVVLMKILEVLRTLTLSPEGTALTNDSICEIMLSCFRICFESRLNGINLY